MKIFYGDKEINYNNPDQYAFLNWRFDDSLGSNNKDNPSQQVFDNYEMGKAYLANSVLTVYTLVETKNACSVADSLIFPVLFNVWHGIELLLKSGLAAISILRNEQNSLKNTHDIFRLRDDFENALIDLGMNKSIKFGLSDLNCLTDEFKRVDANFDFARYSFTGKKNDNYQFYNAPYSDSKQWQDGNKDTHEDAVPNTCVDIRALLESLFKINKTFKKTVNYLTLCVSEGEQATDNGFDIIRKVEGFLDNDDNSNDTDSLTEIIEFISIYIL